MKKRAPKPVELMDFIPKVSPRFRAPTHLAPLVDALERTEREPVHAVVSVPPRHCKTETVKHAIVRRLLLRPQTRIAYVTYAARFAMKKSREIRQLYQRAGGEVVESANTLTDWRTTNTGTDDGGLWATSVGGEITGEGFDLIVIDDPVKSRAIAESAVEREKLHDWYRDTLSTREEPGASSIEIGARWTPGDLGGYLLEEGWESINLPAIDSRGRALCPERFPLSALERIRDRLGEYGWSSLYMGQPFARGGQVFEGTYFYDELPGVPMKIRVGVDLAYSTSARADYSVAVVLGEIEGTYFVLDVLRVQVQAPVFVTRLRALQARYGSPRVCGYFSGTEKGTIDTMAALGLQIDRRAATADKFTRAQPVAAAWNRGTILLPREAPWLDAFVSEIVSFTGEGDRHDDQIDALAAAFDAIAALGRNPPPKRGAFVGCVGSYSKLDGFYTQTEYRAGEPARTTWGRTGLWDD